MYKMVQTKKCKKCNHKNKIYIFDHPYVSIIIVIAWVIGVIMGMILLNMSR